MKKTIYIGFVISLMLLLFNCAPPIKPSITLDKTEYYAGQTVTVTFTAPGSLTEKAWIGIVPSAIPHGDEATNDANDLDYQYLQKQKAGTLTFTAPGQQGSYDFRMNDGKGKELFSVSFALKVVKTGAELKIEKNEFIAGEEIKVQYTAPAEFGKNAWIGIVPATVAHGSETDNDNQDLQYEYIEAGKTGDLTFTAPEAPGSYDLRMHDTDNNGNEILYVRFEVK